MHVAEHTYGPGAAADTVQLPPVFVKMNYHSLQSLSGDVFCISVRQRLQMG